jgi:hypothetical protein
LKNAATSGKAILLGDHRFPGAVGKADATERIGDNDPLRQAID